MNSTIKQVSRTKAKANARQLPASAKKFAQQMGLDMKGLEAEAADIWKMLDEMSTERPIEYQSFIDQQLQQGQEEQKEDKGRYLRPRAGFCVKSRTTGGDGIKVRASANHGKNLYINFCSHEAIQAPRDRNDCEVLDDRHLANDLSIPMLVGTPRDVSDSEIAVDILYHPVVIARCLQHSMFQQQIVELGCEWVTQETKLRFAAPKIIPSDYMGGRGHDKSTPALFYVDPSVVDGGAAGQQTVRRNNEPLSSPSQVLESIQIAQSNDTIKMDKESNIVISSQKSQKTTGKTSQVLIQDLSQDPDDQVLPDKPNDEKSKIQSAQFNIKESKTTIKKASISSSSAIKKGFLNNSSKMQLYPEGKSNEGQSGGAYARLMEKCIVVNQDGSTNKSITSPVCNSIPAAAPMTAVAKKPTAPPAPPASLPNAMEIKEIDKLFADIDDEWSADQSNYTRRNREEEESMSTQLSALAKALCGPEFGAPSTTKNSATATTTTSATACVGGGAVSKASLVVDSRAPLFSVSHSTLAADMLTCSKVEQVDGKQCIHLSFANLSSEKLSAVDIQVAATCIRITVPNETGELKQISLDTTKTCDVANVKAKMSKKKGTVDVYIPIK